MKDYRSIKRQVKILKILEMTAPAYLTVIYI